MTQRVVVVLCGPPGAGKTTAARESGLTVFDRDDAQWLSESQFRAAIARLATDPRARAVVIRAGATSSARQKTRRLVGATHVFVMGGDERELTHRVATRNRGDKRQGIAGVSSWFKRFDRDDGVQDFRGWGVISEFVGVRSREW